MADERVLLKDKLQSLWPSTSTVKPRFFVSWPNMSADLIPGPVVSVYGIDRDDVFKGIGADAKEIETVLAVDIQSRFNTDSITVRDGLITILDSIRKGGAVSGYDLITHNGGRWIEQQVGYEHIVITVRMRKLFQAVS